MAPLTATPPFLTPVRLANEESSFVAGPWPNVEIVESPRLRSVDITIGAWYERSHIMPPSFLGGFPLLKEYESRLNVEVRCSS